jgi:hypothetical protein
MRDIVRDPVKDKIAQGQDRSKREISSRNPGCSVTQITMRGRDPAGRANTNQPPRWWAASVWLAHSQVSTTILTKVEPAQSPRGWAFGVVRGEGPCSGLIEVLLDACRWRLTLWSCANEQRAMRRRIYARTQRDRDRSQWAWLAAHVADDPFVRRVPSATRRRLVLVLVVVGGGLRWRMRSGR